MKKIQLTIAALLFITLTGYSQFSQGTFLAGGNGSIHLDFTANKSKNGSTTTTNSNTTGFLLNPQVGYFVIDKLAIGAGVTIKSTTTKYTDNAPNTTDSEVDLSPFVRYYFYNKFYGQFQFSAGKRTYDVSDGRVLVSNKYNTSGWALAAGYAYLLNEHVAIEPQIGYGAVASNPTNNGNAKDITQGLFIRAGIYIYLFK